MRYGYARVSTEGQRLESQIEELRRAGVDEIYQEKYTGTTTGRPVFKQLLSKLQFGDILVVTKLDRFARNTREALDVMQTLFDHHVGIHILNVGLIDETPTGKLIFTVFSAFAQFERDLIISGHKKGKNTLEHIIPITMKVAKSFIVTNKLGKLSMHICTVRRINKFPKKPALARLLLNAEFEI